MSKGNIIIGTCGYGFYKPGKNWKKKYKNKLQAFSYDFPCVELNKTFYKLPMVKTTKRWREETNKDFEFTIKAWQALTHPVSSPTWRKRKEKLNKKQKKRFGYLKPNKQVIGAWNETKERAEALDAEVCVIQTPGSFDSKKKNEKNMRKFFNKIDRDGIHIAWEPRGNWKNNKDKIKEICDDLNLIHIVDIGRREPASKHKISYIRLHGLNKNEYNYNYDYSKKELKEIAKKLKKLAKNKEKVYCMFNNFEMYKNAKQLMKIT